jgi:high-affinity nickel permease
MGDALPVAVMGFLLGLRHATDADHVVAVTTIVASERSFRHAARIGAFWGMGHSVTVLGIGGALIAFRLTVPPRVGLGLEFGVALMLVILGYANLRTGSGESATLAPEPARSGWRALVVGVVHGLAGSAAVALLMLAIIPHTGWATVYLLVFCAGTIAGMVVVTWLVAAPAVYAARHVPRFQRGIRIAAGALSVAFGLALAGEIVLGGGMFAATPTWTPR